MPSTELDRFVHLELALVRNMDCEFKETSMAHE